MTTIEFRAKVQRVYYADGQLAYTCVKVPKLGRQHCNMADFRRHPKYGSYANSDLFPSMLNRRAKELGVGEYIKLDSVPAGVTVDTTGFLALVTVEV